MIQISDNTQQIQPSKIRKMFNKALEYDRVLSFTLGGRVPGHPRRQDQIFRKCGPAGSAPGYRPLSCAYRRAVLQSGEPDRSNARSYGSIVFSPEGAAEPRR